MKPPRRRMTTRALIAATALFALDFGGLAWALRPEVQRLLGGANAFVGLLVYSACVFGAIGLLFVLIYLYAPAPLDEALMVVLILIVLVAMLVPSLQHSRSRAPRPAGPGGPGRPP